MLVFQPKCGDKQLGRMRSGKSTLITRVSSSNGSINGIRSIPLELVLDTGPWRSWMATMCTGFGSDRTPRTMSC